MVEPLRFVTFLAPSLPLALFEAIARGVAGALRRPVVLRAEERRSGPSGPEDDPLTRGEADVAFVCPPTYLRLAENPAATVALVRAAPVFRDERSGGRPVYFADVVVPAGRSARGLADLRGGLFAYNDVASLSGYHGVLDVLEAAGEGRRFFRRWWRSGSHLASLALVAAGEVDGAAIDSNALSLALRRDPALAARVRTVETIGPLPAQPVVARSTLPEGLCHELARALLALGDDPAAREALDRSGVGGFAPVSEADYRDHPALRGSLRRRAPEPLTPDRRRAPFRPVHEVRT